MAYRIRITDDEMDSLSYIGERYEYASVLVDALEPSPDFEETSNGDVYTLSESDAWEFAEAVEEEDGHLPLLGGELRAKVQTLLDNIV